LNAITGLKEAFGHGTNQDKDQPHPPGKAATVLKLAPILCVAVGVFIVDLLIPKGFADGLLYVAPVAWIALWSTRHEASLVVLVAASCTVCAVVGFFLSPPGLPWLGVANLGITIFIVWLTVVLSLTRKRVEEEVKALRGLLPICSYCKKIRDDKGYWKQIEVYIAANSQADFSHGLCPECGIEHYPDIFPQEHTGTHS
jgi:hypothetical protein